MVVLAALMVLTAYLAEVARNAGCEACRVGGEADQVHLVIRFSGTRTIAELVETLKTSSSKWLKIQGAALRDFACNAAMAASPWRGWR